MRELASAIVRQLDILSREYAQCLSGIESYIQLTDMMRLDIARKYLQVVVSCLEIGDVDAFVRFVTGQVSQDPTALFMIKVLIGLLPGIVMLIGALILFLYPLKGEYLEKIQKQVLEMHKEKHSKLLDMEGKSDS